MKIQLNSNAGGAYSYVYIDRSRGRAIKIFKRANGEEHCRKTFASEVEAYKLAACSVETLNLTPKFHGIKIIEELRSANGDDITHQIIKGCAYEMDFIDGDFVKIEKAPDSEIVRVREIFERAGISYIKDSSCKLDDKHKIICLIDFATKEYELWHSD